MPVAEELHGGGEVDRFVEVADAAGGGLAGGEERQVPALGGLGGQVGDGQCAVPEGEAAAGGVGVLLAGVAGQMHPGVGGYRGQDVGAGCL